MRSEPVLVPHGDEWIPAEILWQYEELGRTRVLLSYRTRDGFLVRRLHWRDELRRPSLGRSVIELDLRVAD